MDWEKQLEPSFSADTAALQSRRPLVLCLTNYVAIAFNANALLAVGASPMMSFSPEEIPELTAQCDALYVNIGCLDTQQAESMRLAVAEARKNGKPWVLDPVGVGASRLRMRLCRELMERSAPAVIRGNASEILSLSGQPAKAHGIDAAESSAHALDAAKKLAAASRSVVVVSGATDYIVDAEREVSVSRGHERMEKVTAMGCTASALVAAFTAVDADNLQAAANAMWLMGTAGERAAAVTEGTGSFAVAFLDELSTLI